MNGVAHFAMVDRARRRFLVGISSACAAGCSGPWSADDADGFDIGDFGGAIDDSLSTDTLARQRVLRSLLLGLVERQDLDDVRDWLAGVSTKESQADFFAGAVVLRRWDFDGPPQGRAFPVRLEFLVDDVAGTKRTDRRIYEVRGTPGRWLIVRIENPGGT